MTEVPENLTVGVAGGQWLPHAMCSTGKIHSCERDLKPQILPATDTLGLPLIFKTAKCLEMLLPSRNVSAGWSQLFSGCLQRLSSSVIFFGEPKLSKTFRDTSYGADPWQQLSATAGGKFQIVVYCLQLAAAKTRLILYCIYQRLSPVIICDSL